MKGGANLPESKSGKSHGHRARDAARRRMYLEEGSLGCGSAIFAFVRKAWIDMYEWSSSGRA